MKHPLLPALWLIILIVGLPLLSETVYTPSLPDIAHALSVSDSLAEYTLTIYLFGFALGTLIWGKLSDKWGRKPCLVAGLNIYLIGCLGCYLSDTIFWLMVSRFIQAFGGSVGSVLGKPFAVILSMGPPWERSTLLWAGPWLFSQPLVRSLVASLTKTLGGQPFSCS